MSSTNRVKFFYVALLLLGSTYTRSQDNAFISISPSIGYMSLGLLHRLTSNPDVIITPPTALATKYGLNVEYSLHVGSAIDASIGIGYSGVNGTQSNRRDVTFAIDGELVDGVIRRDYSVSLHTLGIRPGLALSFDRVSFGAGVMFARPLSITSTGHDVVESPSGITFVSNGESDRESNTRLHSRLATIALEFQGRVAYKAISYRNLDICIALEGGYAPTSWSTTNTWQPWSIGLSAGIRIDASKSAPVLMQPTIPYEKPRIGPVPSRDTVYTNDTTIEAVTWSADIMDSSIAVGMADTITVMDSMHHVTTITQHYIKYIKTARPFLSTILLVDIVDLSIDTKARITAKVDVVSTGSTSSAVNFYVDGVRTKTVMTQKNDTTIEVYLLELVPDIKTRKDVVISVDATTKDSEGQSTAATRRSITLWRELQRKTFNKRADP